MGNEIRRDVARQAANVVGALLACAVILAGRMGPVQGYLTYGATVLWALTGIVVNQYAYSPVTSGAALLAAILVAVVLFGAWRVCQAFLPLIGRCGHGRIVNVSSGQAPTASPGSG